jgi:nanoRNase/pAp phosphatase (c-di-AMP/oligoRNAs hydrolase)
VNVEKTMEYILEQQARFEANLARTDVKHERDYARSSRRLDRIEQVLKQTNRVVGKLASSGVSLRSDIRRHEKAIAKHEEMMEEIEDKLNGLIEVVDKSLRRNGRT